MPDAWLCAPQALLRGILAIDARRAGGAGAAAVRRRRCARRSRRVRPEIVSFHFGLPDRGPCSTGCARAGAKVLASATTRRGGALARRARSRRRSSPRAGKRAAMPAASSARAGQRSRWACSPCFPRSSMRSDVPVIAAGGIADGRGIAAALMLGAAAVQIGTALSPLPGEPDRRLPPRGAWRREAAEQTRLHQPVQRRPRPGPADRA